MKFSGFCSILRKPSRPGRRKIRKTYLLRTGNSRPSPPSPPRKNALIPIWLPGKYPEAAVVPVDLFPTQAKQYSGNKKTRRRLTAGRASKIAILPITGWQTSQSWHPCRCGRADSEVWRGGLCRGSRLQSWQCGEYAGEYAFHAFTIGNFADGESFIDAGTALGDHNALEIWIRSLPPSITRV